VLADCYYATYWLLATAWQNDFDLVCKSHHKVSVQSYERCLAAGGGWAREGERSGGNAAYGSAQSG
jgi:hypothetical protein